MLHQSQEQAKSLDLELEDSKKEAMDLRRERDDLQKGLLASKKHLQTLLFTEEEKVAKLEERVKELKDLLSKTQTDLETALVEKASAQLMLDQHFKKRGEVLSASALCDEETTTQSGNNASDHRRRSNLDDQQSELEEAYINNGRLQGENEILREKLEQLRMENASLRTRGEFTKGSCEVTPAQTACSSIEEEELSTSRPSLPSGADVGVDKEDFNTSKSSIDMVEDTHQIPDNDFLNSTFETVESSHSSSTDDDDSNCEATGLDSNIHRQDKYVATSSGATNMSIYKYRRPRPPAKSLPSNCSSQDAESPDSHHHHEGGMIRSGSKRVLNTSKGGKFPPTIAPNRSSKLTSPAEQSLESQKAAHHHSGKGSDRANGSGSSTLGHKSNHTVMETYAPAGHFARSNVKKSSPDVRFEAGLDDSLNTTGGIESLENFAVQNEDKKVLESEYVDSGGETKSTSENQQTSDSTRSIDDDGKNKLDSTRNRRNRRRRINRRNKKTPPKVLG